MVSFGFVLRRGLALLTFYGTAMAPRKRPRRVVRTLVDVHQTQQPDPVQENEFEKQREEQIRRNREALQKLGVEEAARNLAHTIRVNEETVLRRRNETNKRSSPTKDRGVQKPLVATRRSARIRGGKVPKEETVEEASTEKEDDLKGEHGELLTQEEYFKSVGKAVEPLLVSDGHFRGWVNPAICEHYGIASNADDAWEGNGGGKFTFKIDKKAIPRSLKAKGWSDARAFSSTQLKKNPNAYFYRHVAPHEQQAQGEWTEEEHERFLATAKEFGVGDKWGLFASHISQRVGYQCSAYYREVVIAQGFVFDKRFKMTKSGRVVYRG